MRLSLIALAFGLALAGCARFASPQPEPVAEASPEPSTDAEDRSVVVEAAIMKEPTTLTADDDGKTFVMGVGEVFTVSLPSIPTAGYSWYVTHKPEFLTKTEGFGMVPTDPAVQSQPEFAGGKHFITHHFQVAASGEDDLVLLEGRQWELFEEDGSLKPNWKSAMEGRFQIHLRVAD